MKILEKKLISEATAAGFDGLERAIAQLAD